MPSHASNSFKLNIFHFPMQTDQFFFLAVQCYGNTEPTLAFCFAMAIPRHNLGSTLGMN